MYVNELTGILFKDLTLDRNEVYITMRERTLGKIMGKGENAGTYHIILLR